MKLNRVILAFGIFGMVSCAAPKAIVIEEPPKPKKPVSAPVVVAAPTLPPPLPSNALRMPDMLAMPDEKEFRASNPAATKITNDSGAVIARPPEPPKPAGAP